jgi:hypothetical protein
MPIRGAVPALLATLHSLSSLTTLTPGTFPTTIPANRGIAAC